jgi:hypothetical protein
MSLKFHLLNLHWDFLLEKAWCRCEEQGERFHQDIKGMERRYQDRWNVNMMSDYCWTLHREIPETSRKKKSNIRSFTGKRKRQYKAIEQNLTCKYGNLIIF